jgi:exosome complex exonuclease DIS3/RRP44
MNRSVQGDVVVVEIFPKAQWKAPGQEVLDQDSQLSTVHYVRRADVT